MRKLRDKRVPPACQPIANVDRESRHSTSASKKLYRQWSSERQLYQTLLQRHSEAIVSQRASVKASLTHRRSSCLNSTIVNEMVLVSFGPARECLSKTVCIFSICRVLHIQCILERKAVTFFPRGLCHRVSFFVLCTLNYWRCWNKISDYYY